MIPTPYTRPNGLLGEIADFIYYAAPRPVAEIALAGAIGLMAGICGRAFNVSKTGLNVYVMLIAPTGTGKDAMATGRDALMKSIRNEVPASELFIGPASIASGPALLKYLANTSSCFVSILGEFGLTLQQWSSPKAPAHHVELRKVVLDLYGKSGRNSELRPSIYSEKDKTTATVQSPAFSMIGESTPESFYIGLNERLFADGSLPRFTMIEYRGESQPLQQARSDAPSPELKGRLTELCAYALQLMQKREVLDVGLSEAAMADFDKFEKACTTNVNEANKSNNVVAANLWTRAHMKALKLAALVAIGVDPYHPIITVDHALWAIQIEKETVRNLLSRFEKGEIGDQSNDAVRVNKLRQVFNGFFERPGEELEGYFRADKQLRELRASGVVSERYLFQRIANLAAFKDAPQGAKRAMKDAIEQLIEFGEVVRVPNKQLPNFTNSQAKLYTPSEESSIANGKLKEVVEAKRKLAHLFDDAPPGKAV